MDFASATSQKLLFSLCSGNACNNLFLFIISDGSKILSHNKTIFHISESTFILPATSSIFSPFLFFFWNLWLGSISSKIIFLWIVTCRNGIIMCALFWIFPPLFWCAQIMFFGSWALCWWSPKYMTIWVKFIIKQRV